jgi:serine/threonine-protein kinase
MDKYIGRLLEGRYEILEEIGRGGMAVVYRARCHRLNRYVAVKILKEELSRDEDFRRRFHAESQAVAMLSHPNIVAVYDVNHSGDADYIVMELIDGLTLKQYMQQRGALSWREALHFATQIAKALEHAHSRGIVHRDIKPHNIMILKDGSVKVADFGIARLSSSQNTLTREALGSVHYISPEQAKGAQVDARSDLYSLGVVIYEMLTGKPPYDGESPVAIAIQHINATPVPPRQLNPSIPLGLQQITLHAMCSELGARYTSATAMIEDLEALRKNPQVVFRFNAGPGGTTTYVDTRQIVQAGPQQQRTNTPNAAQQGARRTAAPQQRSVDPQQAAKQKARSMAERSVQRASQEKRSGRKGYTDPDYYEDDAESQKSGKAPIIVVSVLLAVVLIMGGLLWKYILSPSDSGMITVPSFLGKQLEDVLNDEMYQDLNLVEGDSAYSDKYEAGLICDQSISKGQKVTSGTTIRLTISLGAQTEYMPNLVGNTSAEVENALKDLIDQLSIRIDYSYE